MGLRGIQRTINENYFEESSDGMPYVLAVLFPSYKQSGPRDKITVDKRELLEIILQELESNYTIIPYPNRGVSSYWIEFTSKKLRTSLEKKGIVPDKKERKFPEYIKEESQIRTFIRGLIDRKAAINPTKGSGRCITIRYNNQFIRKLNSLLRIHAGISQNDPEHNEVIYGPRNSLKIYNFIYLEESGLFLPSQKEKLELRLAA